MTLDWDGKIRMDCSSPNVMASVVAKAADYDIATGNDADADRHGIVTPDAGLMNPNHYLAVAIDYLYSHRTEWGADMGVGKTLVSSSMIDRVVEQLGRRLVEVPVGFKWFVPGLIDGSIGFGGEESAGASFLRKRGTVWTTDKDGILLALLASEIKAVTGKSPSERYKELTGAVRRPGVRPGRCPGHQGGEGQAGQAVAGGRQGRFAGRREDHRPAGHRARQRRGDRRAEGDHRERLVRRPAVRHRGRLQDLRRVVQGSRAPQAGAGRGPRGGPPPSAAGRSIGSIRHQRPFISILEGRF